MSDPRVAQVGGVSAAWMSGEPGPKAAAGAREGDGDVGLTTERLDRLRLAASSGTVQGGSTNLEEHVVASRDSQRTSPRPATLHDPQETRYQTEEDRNRIRERESEWTNVGERRLIEIRAAERHLRGLSEETDAMLANLGNED